MNKILVNGMALNKRGEELFSDSKQSVGQERPGGPAGRVWGQQREFESAWPSRSQSFVLRMGHGQRQACPGPALAVGSRPGLPEAEALHI